LATAFQEMLECYNIQDKILAFTADNATSNDKQTETLANLNNSFTAPNRVRCFNHTLNLSVKSLLRPFQRPVRHDGTEIIPDIDDFEMPDLEELDENDVTDEASRDDTGGKAQSTPSALPLQLRIFSHQL
ncbi:hypothetical protein C8J56DRAFT_798148, partial [Mycena floridula]